MSYIDVAIPAIGGVIALAWPRVLFYGSRVEPTEQTIRKIRICGVGLLIAAACYLFVKLAAG